MGNARVLLSLELEIFILRLQPLEPPDRFLKLQYPKD
jgi:hypothetical protein